MDHEPFIAGYLVVTIEAVCPYRGIDRLPTLSDHDIVRLRPHLSLINEDWMASDLRAAQSLQAEMATLRPEWSFEVLFVRRWQDSPRGSQAAPPRLTWLGFDVASARAPYASPVRTAACEGDTTDLLSHELNGYGLVDALDVALRVRQSSSGRSQTAWDSADFSVWMVWQAQS